MRGWSHCRLRGCRDPRFRLASRGSRSCRWMGRWARVLPPGRRDAISGNVERLHLRIHAVPVQRFSSGAAGMQRAAAGFLRDAGNESLQSPSCPAKQRISGVVPRRPIWPESPAQRPFVQVTPLPRPEPRLQVGSPSFGPVCGGYSEVSGGQSLFRPSDGMLRRDIVPLGHLRANRKPSILECERLSPGRGSTPA